MTTIPASTTDEPADHMLEAWCPCCQNAVNAECPRCHSNVESRIDSDPMGLMMTAEAVRKMMSWLKEQKNSKFAIHCFMIAYGSADLDGVSMTDVAKQFSTTRANVSKICREICNELHIPPSRAMRREEAALKCKLTNSRPRSAK